MSLNRSLLLSLGTSACLLTACTSGTTPQWMGKGYRYNDNTPLSSPAPSSPWDSDIKANVENMGANAAAWQGATFELVEALSANLAKDGTPLNLSPKSSSPEDRVLDHYLRQALMKKGYNLTSQPEAGTAIVCSTKTLKTKDNYQITAEIKDAKGKTTSQSSVNAVLPFEAE